jgi:pyridoxamine 5'-phosphate oxidase
MIPIYLSMETASLRRSDLDPDPVAQFERWYSAVQSADVLEPTATTLATASKGGIPSARIVLLKQFDRRGFDFSTNYESRKGRELAENPNAVLLFFWPQFNRQVRVGGVVEKVSTRESDEYFRARPVGNCRGAWASQQSAVLPNREELEARLREVQARYPGDTVPRPPNWGGYRLVPREFEFWQARPDRMHDRFRYLRQADASWKIERLAP